MYAVPSTLRVDGFSITKQHELNEFSNGAMAVSNLLIESAR